MFYSLYFNGIFGEDAIYGFDWYVRSVLDRMKTAYIRLLYTARLSSRILRFSVHVSEIKLVYEAFLT